MPVRVMRLTVDTNVTHDTGRLLDGLHILAQVLARTLHLPAQLPWVTAGQHKHAKSQIQLVGLQGRERGEQVSFNILNPNHS